jgi:tol-pal system beta propeller repeat protein TolB
LTLHSTAKRFTRFRHAALYAVRHAGWSRLGVAGLFVVIIAALVTVALSQPVTLRTQTKSVGRIEVVIMSFNGGDSFTGELPINLRDLVKGDLAYSGYFNVLDPADSPLDTVVSVRRVGGSYDTLRTLSGSSPPRVYADVQAAWDGVSASVRIMQPPIVEPAYQEEFKFKSDDVRGGAHQIAQWLTRMLAGEDGAFTSRIAFVVKAGTVKEIWTMDWDGANPRQLSRENTVSFSPSWSPDGKSLYFTTFKNGNADIFKLNTESGRSSSFVASPRVDSAPAVSPDGNWVAYSSSVEGNSEIYLIHPDGSGKTQLTFNHGIDTSPSWSPTGRELIFTSDRGGSPQIYRVDTDGASASRITFAGSYNETARWSPRGDFIAFASREVGFQIFTIDLEAGGERRVTDPGSNLDPSWSPDGMKLVYTSVQGGKSAIWTCNWDGSGSRQLTFGLDASQPQWGPALGQVTEN